MVKNTGGNKSKKVARKNVTGFTTTQQVRRALDEYEMYASVNKIYSAQRCEVLGSDGNTYQCNVRGKFLKNKRGSGDGLAVGVWILIGFYEWEVRSNGVRNCDLLEIYNSVEKDKLKQLEPQNLAVLMKNDGSNDMTFSNFQGSAAAATNKDNDAGADDDNADDADFMMMSSDDEDNARPAPVKLAPVKKSAPAPAPAPVASLANLMKVTKKETLSEQLDWLTINEGDI